MDDLEPTEAASESESETSGQVVLVSGRKLSDGIIEKDSHDENFETPHPAYANSDFYMKHKPELIQKTPNNLRNSDSSSDMDVQDKAFLKQYKNEKSEGKLLNQSISRYRCRCYRA